MKKMKSLFVLLFVLIVTNFTFAVTDTQQNFEKGMQYANQANEILQNAKNSFNPAEVFKEQKGGYTENPAQVNYYASETQSDTQTMANAAKVEITKDEEYQSGKGEKIATPGKSVATGFSTRPVFKVDTDADYIRKGAAVTASAESVTTNSSSDTIKCSDGKTPRKAGCQQKYIEKTCSEAIRPIKKTCTKIPKIHVDAILRPNCQNLIVTQHYDTHCPSGYAQLFYADMVIGPYSDDIRFCVKEEQGNHNAECYSGAYYVARHPGAGQYFGQGVATVPQKTHARIRLSNVYDEYLLGTIINETTGVTLHDKTKFINGQTIELPFSETQDQTFKFYPVKRPSTHSGFFRHLFNRQTGVMVLYMDRIHKEARVTWEEGECNES